MKFLNYLEEEYVGTTTGTKVTFKFLGGSTEIFVNPSNKEIRDAMNAGSDFWKGKVRFIADFANKDLYVFKADTLHDDVDLYLRSEGKLKGTIAKSEPTTKTIWGVASKGTSGKLLYVGSDTLGSKDKVLELNDEWTSKWFDEPIIQAYKRMVHMK